MKDFLLALQIALYETRFKLYALALTVVGWLLFATATENFLGRQYLDAVVYVLVGWYWLGNTVVPYVEKKLEKVFDFN